MSMIKLYRGLNDILVYTGQEFKDKFIKHIRSFNAGESKYSLGSAGYWNFILEFIFIIFIKFFVAIGVILTVIMAIIFFPLNALKEFFSQYFNIFKNEYNSEVQPGITNPNDIKK
jgi:nitrogen fixation/metabolism regulation signal transduction histidine kinase